MLTSRTAFRPFYELFNAKDNTKAIAIPFLLALSMPALSILVSIVVQRRVKRAKKRFPNFFVESNSDPEESMLSGSKSVVQQIKSLSGTIWLVIGVVVLVNVLVRCPCTHSLYIKRDGVYFMLLYSVATDQCAVLLFCRSAS